MFSYITFTFPQVFIIWQSDVKRFPICPPSSGWGREIASISRVYFLSDGVEQDVNRLERREKKKKMKNEEEREEKKERNKKMKEKKKKKKKKPVAQRQEMVIGYPSPAERFVYGSFEVSRAMAPNGNKVL